jgi:hypothetical protein
VRNKLYQKGFGGLEYVDRESKALEEQRSVKILEKRTNTLLNANLFVLL